VSLLRVDQWIQTQSNLLLFHGRRLWFVHVSGSRKAALLNVAPAEIGYMNVIPKCTDASGKYPQYEGLPDTYAAINAYLSDAPLEGRSFINKTVTTCPRLSTARG